MTERDDPFSYVMVDSNVLIHLLRTNRDPIRYLDPWKKSRDFMTCGMVRLEVERGVIGLKARRRVNSFFGVLMDVPTSSRICANATEIAWTLDRSGVVLPAQDILIAAHAMKFGGAILSSDVHFRKIPGLRVYDPAEEFSDW
jgi:predicted nucleic acid-binding protein